MSDRQKWSINRQAVRQSRGTVRVEAKSRSQKQAEVGTQSGRETTGSSTKGLARLTWLNRNRLAKDRQTEQRSTGKISVKNRLRSEG